MDHCLGEYMMSDTQKKILIADSIASVGVKKLKRFCKIDCDYSITSSALVENIREYNGLIVRSRTKVTEELIERGSQLEVIGRCGVGVDNIDIEACRKNGVLVVNSPLASSIAVGELTIGLMLSLARRMPFCDKEVKSGNWPKSTVRGYELNGKTLGLIAIGRIGAEVARLANAFGMRVIGYDPYISDERFLELNVNVVGYEELLMESDYISLHAPLTDETKNMINVDTINLMKHGVRIICAARGGLIDEEALYQYIESGKIAGAGLDVFEKEPPGFSKLVGHPNVVVSPHIGAQTVEAQDRAGIDVANEVIAALKGESLRWRIV